MENGSAALQCELTKPAEVEWKKGQKVLQESSKYEMSQDGSVAKLIIHELEEEDAGVYTCVCGDEQTTATLTVHGKKNKPKTKKSKRFSYFLKIKITAVV